MPLPRPTVRTDLHEGQGEGKDGDGGTHLITSASSNKHHPVSRAQVRYTYHQKAAHPFTS